VLVAWKLDRLGRSTLDLVGLVEKLKGRGVGLKVLTGEGASIDTTRPEGKLIFAVFAVFAAFAEFERELIRERTMAGMRAAKRRRRANVVSVANVRGVCNCSCKERCPGSRKVGFHFRYSYPLVIADHSSA
jgi:DNA invertase Pin-like site-specific DNA recombinase